MLGDKMDFTSMERLQNEEPDSWEIAPPFPTRTYSSIGVGRSCERFAGETGGWEGETPSSGATDKSTGQEGMGENEVEMEEEDECKEDEKNGEQERIEIDPV